MLMESANIFYRSYNQRMKDQELYDLIKQAVRQRKQIPHHSQAQTFAQRYCEQQLQKKYKPYHSSTQKMGMIMKNFSKLNTYFNLPQLIESLRHLKHTTTDKNSTLPASFVPPLSDQELKSQHPFTKQYTELRNFRHITENEGIRQLLSSLEGHNEWRSQTVKNNSSYHMSCVDNSINQERESHPSHESVRLFRMLHSFLKNQKEEDSKQQSVNVDQPRVSKEKKKEITRFLHKVSSYLQIVLENQHKHKWNRQRQSDLFEGKPATQSKSAHYKIKQCKKPVILQDMTNTKCIETIKQQTRFVKQFSKTEIVPETNQHYRPNRASYKFTQNQIPTEHAKRPIKTKKEVDWKQTDEILCNDYSIGDGRAKNNSIRENFTFRRRSIKEKIIKKLDQFIYDIDEETHSNRKQNNYYNHEINKLEHHFKRLYGRYRKETIAGDQDIETLKQLAQEYSIVTPPQQSIKAHNASSSHQQTVET